MNELSSFWLHLVYKIKRIPFWRRVVGLVFTKMSFLLPVERLRETPNWIAFYHPHPVYRFHVLITPKRRVANLTELAGQEDRFTADLFGIVKSLVEEFKLEVDGYRLIANGGKYQDFPLLHFHLIAE